MNINKTLCKYLDIEKKGYVCIGDVFYFTFFYGVISATLYGFVYSGYRGLLLIVSGKLFDETYNNSVIESFGCAVILLFVVITIIVIVAYIGTIKIAKCEYKKN